MRVIAVDDEMESLSNFLIQIIEDTRVEYKFFLDNPLDSIDYCSNNHVDAAFLDIRMPQINGIELAQKLIKISPEIKIIFITGFTYDEEEIKKTLNENLLGFCYKPFDSDKLNYFINIIASKGESKINIKTFGPFDLFLNGHAVNFKSTKAKELLALLVAYNGSTLTMSDAITHLWPNKDVELAKKLYRDAVWRLRKALKDCGISGIIKFEKAKTNIRTEGIECDYWDYLNGKKELPSEDLLFMSSYDWGDEFFQSPGVEL